MSKRLKEEELKDINGGTLVPGDCGGGNISYKYKCNSCKNEFLKLTNCFQHPKCPNCKSTDTEFLSAIQK